LKRNCHDAIGETRAAISKIVTRQAGVLYVSSIANGV